MADRLQQIKQLYHEAVECDAAERAAFLDRACAGDEALRQEVESLLASDARTENLIQAAAVDRTAGRTARPRGGSLGGRMLGPYRILSLLGTGGMGEVYRATDTRLDRDVAIKVLPEHLARDPEALARFEREAKAVAALSHPNIMAIHDFGSHEGVCFAVMELLEGETLRHHLERSPLAWRRALQVGIAVADGLSAAHAKSFIHRDLKPENIFLTSNGQVKILDFGIARAKRTPSARAPGSANVISGATKPGTVIGTLGYISPEQLQGMAAEAPSDIFAFGCVLYEMLTGRRAFAGETLPEIMAAILKADPPALVGEEIPGDVDRVVLRCLEKAPEARFQSAGDLSLALRTILSGSRTTTALPLPFPLRPRARPWMAVLLVPLLLAASLYLTRGRAKPIDSLAILPLVNESANAETDYLSDGITESVINALSRLPRLRVMARTTVFRYKGREVDPRQIGRELNVRAVLTGRMVQRGDTLSIQVDLVDASDGSQLWGEQYHRKPADLLVTQEEIAKRISEKLLLRLSGEEEQRLTKRYTGNTEAYQLYLKGRYHWSQYTKEGFRKGVDYFTQATELDPGYALAYAGLADAYYRASLLHLPPKEAMPKGREAANRALELDDTLAEAHTALGVVRYRFDWDWSGARREFRRAIELNPNYATAHEEYGYYLACLGEFDESLRELKRAQELDPLSLIVSTKLGAPLYLARRYDQAIAQFQKALDLDPRFVYAHVWLALAHEQKGEFPKAIAVLEKARSLDDTPVLLGLLGRTYAVAGRRGEARRALDELRELSKRRFVSSYSVGAIFAGLGDKDRAFASLDKAYEERDEWLDMIRSDPWWDTLRADPRFADLLRRLNLTP